MSTSWRLILVVTLFMGACTSSGGGSDDANDALGQILSVTRARSEVGDSDDFGGRSMGIEREFRGASACVYIHRTTPGGDTYALRVLLANAPEAVGEDWFSVDGLVVRSGDRISGDAELGSAERPPAVAELYAAAKQQLAEACESFKLEEVFDEVFDEVPIIFIEENRTQADTGEIE
ncbi:MAG: hypothetical protein HKN03_02250 [Acidimicrobiales bacterium]|nr:hypothetical protein [Acidimicrobiales bacterium]